MKRAVFLLGIGTILCLLTLYLGIQIGETRTKEAVAAKEYVETIALVNLDQGVMVDGLAVSYGTQLLNLMGGHFKNTSLEEARNGVENGRFAAYVILPATFSAQVWSINTQPEKAVLEYAINPNLHEDLVPDVIYNLKAFEMQLNANVSYLYLYSILDEFHRGQKSAEVIMVNDKRDLERLTSISLEELIRPLDFVELSYAVEAPQYLELKDGTFDVAKAVDQIGFHYEEYVGSTQTDLELLLEENSTIRDAMDSMKIAVEDLRFLEDSDGNPLYEEGRDALFEDLEEYQNAVAKERNELTEVFRFMGSHQQVASPSDAEQDANTNTWMDQIRQEAVREREEYEEQVTQWRESFDYTKLATPSVATPPNATPSDATPSDASPSNADKGRHSRTGAEDREDGDWLLERDLSMSMMASEKMYDEIERRLGELILDEQDLENVMDVLSMVLLEEDQVLACMEAASRGHPIVGSSEADRYVEKFLASMPMPSFSVEEQLRKTQERITEFGNHQIEKIRQYTQLPAGWLNEWYEDQIVQKAEKQETDLQEKMQKEVDSFQEAFDGFQREIERFETTERFDRSGLEEVKREVENRFAEVEQSVNDKVREDEDYIRLLEDSKEKDIQALEESLELSQNGTSDNIGKVLEEAVSGRAEIQQENEGMLSAFTKKLPYTKNGSIAATDTYDFLINPVSVKEKKLSERFHMLRKQGVRPDYLIVIGVLCALVGVLFIQNGRLRSKKMSGNNADRRCYKKTKEEES